MSVEKLSSILVREGFSVVGVNAWKMRDILIKLAEGFFVVKFGDDDSLSFPFMEDEDLCIMFIDGDLVIWWNGMRFVNKI